MGNRRYRRAFLGLLAAAAGATLYAGELELKPATLKIWMVYEHTAELAMHERLDGGGKFLRVDKFPDRIARVRAGEIVVWSALETNPMHISSGLIHDWIGAAFIPNARIVDVISVVRDYRRYKQIYKPGVLNAKLLKQTDSEDRFSMVLRNPSFFNKTALDVDFDSTYTRLDEARWYSTTYVTRLQEIADYGQPAERKLPPDCGHGYIWRMSSFSQMEERDGGVYVEEELVVLSRGVPAAVLWMAGPIIRREARESTASSIEKTRVAVGSKSEVISVAKPSTGAPGGHDGAVVCGRGYAVGCLR
jgi:hypothetical protein